MCEKLQIKRAAKITDASTNPRRLTQTQHTPQHDLHEQYLPTYPGIWKKHSDMASRKKNLCGLFGYDAYAVLDKATLEHCPKVKHAMGPGALLEQMKVCGADGPQSKDKRPEH